MKTSTKFRCAFALLLSLAMATVSAAPAAKKPYPNIRLQQPVSGEAAIRSLGATLPQVAAWYGKSTQEFARLIREDRSLWLDERGRAHYVDQGLALPEQGATADDPANTEPSSAPLEQTFLLHSKPSANRVIYLDFNGEMVSNTAWNSSYAISLIDASPYDTDGNPATFSDTELQNIQYIWQRVAEDYAAFDVDVTTETPPPEALSRSSASDTAFGTRVLISRDWTTNTSRPCGCGGFAYLGVFDDTTDYYKPAWVFFDRLGNGNEKYVAEAISHEAGHNLGLNHDGYNNGSTSTSYYSGHGSGATGWAPIMGVGYYRELTQWSKGEYPYATNKEDDLVIIQNNGAPLRTDDHGDDMASASALTSVENAGSFALSGAGVIRARGDIDIFRFGSGAGSIQINLSPFERGPNLDASLGLYNSSGNLVASSSPTDGLGASIAITNAEEGIYYLRVDGVGKGDLTTGYSDYGSLGWYNISGSATASGGTAPIAQISANPISGAAPLPVAFIGSASYDPDGGDLSHLWNFGDGYTSTQADVSHTYNTPGVYTATLNVTDSSGASDASQTTITVSEPSLEIMHVQNIAMSLSFKRKNARASATITLLDANGKPVNGATLSGAWSGVVSGTANGVTNNSGVVKFSSPWSSKYGAFTFTVNGVTLQGYSYDSDQNIETTDSITR